uniref:NADH-ubiquinone oxidoreductase chain 6 n=1 Tax=Spondylis buprestoides TaxID=1395520 RepID=A0A7H0R0C2_9CUCU|nr:NADH dehydrogenase subunit 6 [Spondylis buprestoides]QNQ64871.1 NADH dehydrogenase subunit 6 [Spondylis buprestoides]
MMMMTMLIMMSLSFMLLNHPLSFGLNILMQTILICLITGLMNYNFWFSYILFLIMIGGMLILFIYMTSIASNEKFKFSLNLMIITIFSLILMMMMIFIDYYFMNLNLLTYDMINQNYMKINNFSMSKYMNHPMNLIFMMIIIYLLITLIMVVKITNLKYGPLRQKF